ncbi:hypothetical protein CR513_04494, partial [Mucuna pruriens]
MVDWSHKGTKVECISMISDWTGMDHDASDVIINELRLETKGIHQQGTIDSKQCNPSNSGANLGLKRGGFCLGPLGDDGFESLLVVLVLDSASAEEEVPTVLGFEFAPFTGPMPKENLHVWPCAISKWLKIDIIILLCLQRYYDDVSIYIELDELVERKSRGKFDFDFSPSFFICGVCVWTLLSKKKFLCIDSAIESFTRSTFALF